MNMASKVLILLLGVLSICAARDGNSQDLSEELKKQSESQGLMIAGAINQFLRVIPFSGSPFARWFLDYTLNAVRFSPDGTAVLAYVENPVSTGIRPETMALIGSDGKVVSVLDRVIGNIADMALSADRIHVVVAGMDPVTREVGIFVGKLGTSEMQLIVRLKSESGVPLHATVGWVPDGHAVVFSRDGAVWTYNLDSREASLLLPLATNPACSPDGKWIAFRSSKGYAMLALRSGGEPRRASRGKMSGSVHWSPDSAYYFVDEVVRGASVQRCPVGVCFVVYRVRDGARLELYGSNLRDTFFGWIRGSWALRGPLLP
jgi:hypothetical protein